MSHLERKSPSRDDFALSLDDSELDSSSTSSSSSTSLSSTSSSSAQVVPKRQVPKVLRGRTVKILCDVNQYIEIPMERFYEHSRYFDMFEERYMELTEQDLVIGRGTHFNEYWNRDTVQFIVDFLTALSGTNPICADDDLFVEPINFPVTDAEMDYLDEQDVAFFDRYPLPLLLNTTQLTQYFQITKSKVNMLSYYIGARMDRLEPVTQQDLCGVPLTKRVSKEVSDQIKTFNVESWPIWALESKEYSSVVNWRMMYPGMEDKAYPFLIKLVTAERKKINERVEERKQQGARENDLLEYTHSLLSILDSRMKSIVELYLDVSVRMRFPVISGHRWLDGIRTEDLIDLFTQSEGLISPLPLYPSCIGNRELWKLALKHHGLPESEVARIQALASSQWKIYSSRKPVLPERATPEEIEHYQEDLFDFDRTVIERQIESLVSRELQNGSKY